MEMRTITRELIDKFQMLLKEEEKSDATIKKYVRDVTAFAAFVQDGSLTKETVIAYKQYLMGEGYAACSINSMLASLNSFFCSFGWTDLKVKSLKIQRDVFRPEEKELTRAEYERLCRTARKKKNERLSLVLQTICSTGIRVSELPFITAEAVRSGRAIVSIKRKTRTVFILKELQKKLLLYMSAHKIIEGPVFITRSGKPLNRTNIWRDMKSLCEEANVNPHKVFPHNLRHLFARIFYSLEKDIVKLADVLGHSSLNTTRIYIISTGIEHRRFMKQMRLVI